MPREGLLTKTLVELADTLVADFDVVELLTRLADRCVDVLGVAAAGLMLVAPDGDLRVMASSSEAMRVLELFELQSQEGPVPGLLPERPTGHGPRPGHGQRPLAPFSAEALAAGFRSVHALPMRLRGTVIGALNLFHLEAGEMQQRRRRGRPGPGRCRHHRHPPAPRHARGPGPQPTAPARPQQPHRHRAGQGDGGRESRPRHGAGLLRLAQVTPVTTTCAWST